MYRTFSLEQLDFFLLRGPVIITGFWSILDWFKEILGNFRWKRSWKYRSQWECFLGFHLRTCSHFLSTAGEMSCWLHVRVPTACCTDRTGRFCLIAWLYLNPPDPRTSWTGHTTYFGKNLSSLTENDGDGDNEKEAGTLQESGKGGDQEGLWPQTVQEIRRDPSWATWEVWIKWQEGQERSFWRGCVVAGLIQCSSAGLSHSDLTQGSDKIPRRPCSGDVMHLELRQTLETFLKVKTVQ